MKLALLAVGLGSAYAGPEKVLCDGTITGVAVDALTTVGSMGALTDVDGGVYDCRFGGCTPIAPIEISASGASAVIALKTCGAFANEVGFTVQACGGDEYVVAATAKDTSTTKTIDFIPINDGTATDGCELYQFESMGPGSGVTRTTWTILPQPSNVASTGGGPAHLCTEVDALRDQSCPAGFLYPAALSANHYCYSGDLGCNIGCCIACDDEALYLFSDPLNAALCGVGTCADFTYDAGLETCAATVVADVDCEVTYSACTAACETALEREPTFVVERSGAGAICDEAVDCADGDGACVMSEPPSTAPTASPVAASPTATPEKDGFVNLVPGAFGMIAAYVCTLF